MKVTPELLCIMFIFKVIQELSRVSKKELGILMDVFWEHFTLLDLKVILIFLPFLIFLFVSWLIPSPSSLF